MTMADQATLPAQKRSVLGKAVKQLRRQGLIPANITGRKSDPMAIQVEGAAFERFMKEHSRTTLIRMAIPGVPAQTALIGHVQREPVSGKIQHVDFLQVELDQQMRTRVPIRVAGESPAVKSGEGILLHLHNEIEIEALPSDLPNALEIDVSGLEQVDDAAYVRDIRLPARVKLAHANPDDVVVKVVVTRAAIEEVAAAAAPAPEGTAAEAGAQGTPSEQE